MSDELKPMQPWGEDGPTIRVGERDPKTGRVPVHIPETPRPPVTFLSDLLADFNADREARPDPREYAAGFRARLADIPVSDAAHPSWRDGWNDADTEAHEAVRHCRALEEGREDAYPAARGLLFDAGRAARLNGLPFDQSRSAPWQQGWVVADIEIGDEAAF